jgi:hypothetical protein
MKHISELKIEQDNISVFCSGESIMDITLGQMKSITNNTFSISLNYAFKLFATHMIMWYDKRVSDTIRDYAKGQSIWVTNIEALGNGTIGIVDYYYDKSEGNYTAVILFQLLQRYFPDKKVYVFGLDMTGGKWYGEEKDMDWNFDQQKELDKCRKQIDEKITNKEQFINCSPISKYDGFRREKWKH